MTVSLLLAAPALADTGGKIRVQSVRQFTPAATTRVVSEASSTSYTMTREEDGTKAAYGPTSKTTYVETTPKIEVAGVKELSQPADATPLASLCLLVFSLTLFAFLSGVFIGRRRLRA